MGRASGTTTGDTPSSAGTTAILGGTISRGEVIQRAQNWVSNYVVYIADTGYGYENSATGGPYRQDCSGMASMALGLTQSLNTKDLAADTADFTTVSRSQLQEGDLLDDPADHVIIFYKWINQSAGTFEYYYEGNTDHPAILGTDGNLNLSLLDGHPTYLYKALSYKKLTGGSSGPAIPSVTLTSPAAGSTVGGVVTVTASATDATSGVTFSTQFFLDGNAIGTAIAGAAPSYQWNSSSASDGPHTLTATTTATNSSGTSAAGQSASVAIQVDSGYDYQFAEAQETDGSQRVFAVNAAGEIWTTAQSGPNGSWPLAWNKLGTAASDLTATTEQDGRIVLIARSANDQTLWYDEETAPGSGVFSAGWAQLGGASSAPAVAVHESDGRIAVLSQNPATGVFWYDEESAANSATYSAGWTSVGGAALGLTATAESDGRIVLIERGTDRTTWFDEETAAGSGTFASGWTQLGGASAVTPVTTREANGRIVVFAQNPTSDVFWYDEETAPGSATFATGWTSVGSASLDLSTATESDGRAVLYERATNGSVWYDEETASNSAAFSSGWTEAGTSSAMYPIAAEQADGTLSIFSQDPSALTYWVDDETGPSTAVYSSGWTNISN